MIAVAVEQPPTGLDLQYVVTIAARYVRALDAQAVARAEGTETPFHDYTVWEARDALRDAGRTVPGTDGPVHPYVRAVEARIVEEYGPRPLRAVGGC